MRARRCLVWLLVVAWVLPAKAGTPTAQPRTDRYGDPLPDGAVARLGTVRLRQAGAVSTVAFSPDGKLLVSSGPGVVYVWDAKTGAETNRIETGFRWVNTCVFPGDGKVLAVGGNVRDGPQETPSIKLFDVQTTEQVGSLRYHRSEAIDRIAVSPDGRFIASGGYFHDAVTNSGVGELLIWDLATNTPLHVCDVPDSRVLAVAFSPDGKTVATNGPGQTIRLWDVATGKERMQWETCEAPIKRIAFSPDGKTIASGGFFGVTDLSLWDATNGKLLRTLKGPKADAFNGVSAVAYSPDGTLLAAGYRDNLIRLWDPATGMEVGRLQGHVGGLYHSGALSLAFTADGKTLASGGMDHTIRLWDMALRRERFASHGHAGRVRVARFLPDGRHVASAGNDGTIRVWDVRSKEELKCFSDHTEEVYSLAVSPDGRKLASGSRAGRIIVSDAETGRPLWQHAVPLRNIYGLAFSPDAKTVVFDDWDQGPVTAFWDAIAGKRRREVPGLSNNYLFTSDGKRLIGSGARGGIVVYDMGADRPVMTIAAHQSHVDALALSPDGRTVFSAGGDRVHDISFGDSRDNRVRLWELSSGKRRLELEGDPPQFKAIAVSPDGQTLFAAGVDGKLRVWDLTSGKLLRETNAHRGEVMSLAVSRDGRTLLSASADTTLLLWNVAELAPARPALVIRREAKEVTALWERLASDDGEKAYEAVIQLAATPDQAVPHVRKSLQPVPAPDKERIARLIADLGSDRFTVRETAAGEFQQIGELAEPALRKAVADAASAQVRRRAAELLSVLDGPVTFHENLRAIRAVEVLERIATPDARQLLESLAKGAPEAWLTQDAKRSLERLAARPGRN